ncbi:hypothetical protein CRG98_036905 [Punica granatum]|uniref:Uncharacterized protein n=1 Tax=Punica granatum TaxID=22663 RepID=A0A2I0IFM4_PUNGR|nr:hypothetical protein CRG98_036905 [Punica granatum]
MAVLVRGGMEVVVEEEQPGQAVLLPVVEAEAEAVVVVEEVAEEAVVEEDVTGGEPPPSIREISRRSHKSGTGVPPGNPTLDLRSPVGSKPEKGAGASTCPAYLYCVIAMVVQPVVAGASWLFAHSHWVFFLEIVGSIDYLVSCKWQ